MTTVQDLNTRGPSRGPRFAWPEVCVSRSEVSRLLGIDQASASKMATCGLTFWQADRLAVALGAHPAELWPDWMQYSISSEELTAYGAPRRGCTKGGTA